MKKSTLIPALPAWRLVILSFFPPFGSDDSDEYRTDDSVSPDHSIRTPSEGTEGGCQSFQWAKSAGGTSDDVGYSVSTDAGGIVFVTGWFQSSTITVSSMTLTNAGQYDFFLANIMLHKILLILKPTK